MENDLPNQSAMGPWRPTGYAESDLPLSAMPAVDFKGNEPLLYPTHPQQLLKLYHQYDVSRYDQRKLEGTDETCMISRLTRMRDSLRLRTIARAKERGRRIPCQKGDEAYRLLFSDTYVDDRGNFYRAAARQVFLKSNESMGHSVALGHTVYARPGGNYGNGVVDAYDGDTYPVGTDEFVKIARLLPSDAPKISELQQKAQRTHRREGLVWRYNG